MHAFASRYVCFVDNSKSLPERDIELYRIPFLTELVIEETRFELFKKIKQLLLHSDQSDSVDTILSALSDTSKHYSADKKSFIFIDKIEFCKDDSEYRAQFLKSYCYFQRVKAIYMDDQHFLDLVCLYKLTDLKIAEMLYQR